MVNGRSASLVASVNSKAYGGTSGASGTVTLATLSLPTPRTSGGTISWSGATATLTAAGAEAFGGFYQAGTTLDPVSFSFPLGGEVECDASTGTLPATGAVGMENAGLGAIGALLLGLVLVATRRRFTVTRD